MPDVSASDVPNLQRGPANQVRMNRGAAMAPGQGLQAMGQAVGEAGSVFQRLAEEKKKSGDIAARADAKRQMKQAYAAYEQGLGSEENPDESKWGENWMKKSDELKTSILANKSLSDDARKAIEIDMADWNTDSTIKINGAAVTAGIKRDRAQVLAAAEEELKAGNFEAYENEIRGMTPAMMDDDTKNKTIKKAKERYDYHAAVNRILDNPRAALHELKNTEMYENLDPWSKKSLISHAETRDNNQKSDLYNQLIDDKRNGTIMHPDDLRDMVDNGELTMGQMNAYLATAYSKPKIDDDKYVSSMGDLMTEIQNYDPSKDQNNRKKAALLAETLKYEKTHATVMRGMFNEKEEKEGYTSMPVYKNAVSYIDDMFNNGAFGDVKVAKESGQMTSTYRAASETKMKLYDSLYDLFVKTGGKVSNEDAMKHLQGITRTDRNMNQANALTLRVERDQGQYTTESALKAIARERASEQSTK